MSQSPNRQILTTVAVLLLGPQFTSDALVGQDTWTQARHASGRGIRIAFPDSVPVPVDRIGIVLDSATAIRRVGGVPPSVLGDLPIVISLAKKMPPGVDGWADAQERLVVVPLSGFSDWSLDRLIGVLRHEIAHVALARYLGITAPFWLREGFAQWAAGVLTCEDRLRVRRRVELDTVDLEMLILQTDGATAVRSDVVLLGMFFLFLDRDGGVSDGTLLSLVKDRGAREALRAFTREELRVLDERWVQALREQYVARWQSPTDCSEQ